MTASLVVERRGDHWSLRGLIDEHAGLARLAEGLGDGATLHLDLEHVAHVNSLGVRDWVFFLRGLSARRVAVRLSRCSGVMVNQMNMIVDARGGAAVDSFFAPFDCAACGWDGEALLETPVVAATVAARARLEARCPDCGEVARFADLIDRYFLFLADPSPALGAP